MSVHRIRMSVNGVDHELDVDADRLLVDALRDDIGLTGTKVGCGIGVCGACSVLIDGRPMTGCLMLAVQAEGRAVTTVEGLAASDGTLSPLQDAFIRQGGFQCGICTPGQLIVATALLEETPRPREDEIRSFMLGNLCRCTGYYGIVRAIQAAAAVGT